MKLNEKQKMFLIEKGYVDKQSLDAIKDKEWYKYYVNNYEWHIEENMEYEHHCKNIIKDIYLIDTKVKYENTLFFQNNDYQELLSLRTE